MPRSTKHATASAESRTELCWKLWDALAEQLLQLLRSPDKVVRSQTYVVCLDFLKMNGVILDPRKATLNKLENQMKEMMDNLPFPETKFQ